LAGDGKEPLWSSLRELLERTEQAVGLQERRDTSCKMRRRRQAMPLLMAVNFA
jgi:hypothetical protein